MRKDIGKGEDTMNAYAIKSDMPFVTSRRLKRTPPTRENIDMVKFMDSHEFSFHMDKSTGKFASVIKKNDI